MRLTFNYIRDYARQYDIMVEVGHKKGVYTWWNNSNHGEVGLCFGIKELWEDICDEVRKITSTA